jgi:hypothetical protein
VYEKAKNFAEAMRKLCGWKWDVDRVLRSWEEKVIREPFFEKTTGKDGYPIWTLKPDPPGYELPADFIRFACYIAVCHVKYGASYDSLTAKEIFGHLTNLGSDLPAKLKKYGSGDLPEEVSEYKDSTVSCKANDVFATIKIILKDDSEESHRKALDFICRLLETCGFPKSYAIEFRSPVKNWLPIKGLPKKGVHHLFANAARFPALHEKIERYARLAMNEFEWYENLEDESCSMPGTFAVFALGLLGEKYHSLVCDYLKICDGEHQGIHGQFVLAYIEKYGFTKQGFELYDLCEENLQHLPKKLATLRKKVK